jgi:hypothetical protein
VATIFRCFDDPVDGPFLTALGLTDDDLVRYIVERANGSSEQDALDRLVEGRILGQTDAEHVRSIVEKFQIVN